MYIISINNDWYFNRKKIEEVENILNNFLKMQKEKKYDEKVLNEAIVFDEVSKTPNREKCVLLSWWGIEKVLNEIKK